MNLGKIQLRLISERTLLFSESFLRDLKCLQSEMILFVSDSEILRGGGDSKVLIKCPRKVLLKFKKFTPFYKLQIP